MNALMLLPEPSPAGSLDATCAASARVDRSVRRSGCQVECAGVGGAPRAICLSQSTAMTSPSRETAGALVGQQRVRWVGYLAVSIDIGGLSHLVPGFHLFGGGRRGHQGKDRCESASIVDETMAAVTPPMAMAMPVVNLLWRGTLGREPVEDHKPAVTRMECLDHLRGMGESS